MKIVGLLHAFSNICLRGSEWCAVHIIDVFHDYASELNQYSLLGCSFLLIGCLTIIHMCRKRKAGRRNS